MLDLLRLPHHASAAAPLHHKQTDACNKDGVVAGRSSSAPLARGSLGFVLLRGSGGSGGGGVPVARASVAEGGAAPLRVVLAGRLDCSKANDRSVARCGCS